MSEPRAYTIEECRKMLLDHFDGLADYWAKLPASSLFRAPNLTEDQARLRGLLFSILVTLDGGNMDIPGFNLIPKVDPLDQLFYEKEGQNWWPAETVVNDCQLHELMGR